MNLKKHCKNNNYLENIYVGCKSRPTLVCDRNKFKQLACVCVQTILEVMLLSTQ